MNARSDTEDFRALFLTHTPLLDLRAPAEFTKGAFPSALSLPLMSDEERAQVGICYKQDGQEAAIALGHQLVAGSVRQRRMTAWLEFAQLYPESYLYCWRGGLRSQTVQQWLAAEGVFLPRVIGGYKAMRRYLIDELTRSVESASFIIIGGKTGTGKTRAIQALQRMVDLEGLANHRGSSFGQMPTPQPSQIDFENSLSIALLRLLNPSSKPIFLEDEGRLVGRLYLPEVLRDKMRDADMVVVEEPLESRIDVVLEDYVVDLGRRYALLDAHDGAIAHQEKLLGDLGRIRKRLGGDRYQAVSELMTNAFAWQANTGDTSRHRQWIGDLLTHYYDPMYDYQLSQREGDRVYSGSRDEVVAWAKQQELA